MWDFSVDGNKQNLAEFVLFKLMKRQASVCLKWYCWNGFIAWKMCVTDFTLTWTANLKIIYLWNHILQDDIFCKYV